MLSMKRQIKFYLRKQMFRFFLITFLICTLLVPFIFNEICPINAKEITSYSATDGTLLPKSPPDQVTGLVVRLNPLGNRLDLSWNITNGAVGYQVFRSFNVSYTLIANTTNTFYNDSGLLDGLRYYYKVRAYNEIPEYGIDSIVVSGIPQDTTPPSQVTGLFVSVVASGNQLGISWAPASGGDVAGYRIWRNITATIYTLITTRVVPFYNDTGLVDGIRYCYKISAYDEVPNYGLNATPVSGMPKDTIPPSQVTGVVVRVNTTGNKLDISWNPSSAGDLAGYRVWRNITATTFVIVTTRIVNYYNDTGLLDGIRYYYKIQAYDEVPNYSPDSISVFGVPRDTTSPPQVSGVTVNDTGIPNTLYITWTASNALDIVGYKILRSRFSAGTYNVSFNVLHPLTYYIDTGLINGATYYYKISAYDEVPNFSTNSSVASGKSNIFRVTAGNHTETENLTQIVQSEFGPNFRVADWYDLMAVIDIESWAADLGMEINDTYLVTYGGEEVWAGIRHYYIQRFDHNPPGEWLVHDDLDNKFICLGSWYGLYMPILAIWNGYLPNAFSIYSPISWISNQTPTVISQFFLGGSGLNVTSVQYAYSTTGSSTPTNWATVNGVYTNASCTTYASNGATGLIYIKVTAVPFNQNSETLNTIRFHAADMDGNLIEQNTAVAILIDNASPVLGNPIINPSDPKPSDLLNISVTVIDSGSGIASVLFYYDMGHGWNSILMNYKNGTYTVAINLESTTELLKYYIVVTDNAGNQQTLGTQSTPEMVEITKTPADNLLILIIICIGATAAISGAYITLKRRYYYKFEAGWIRIKKRTLSTKRMEGEILPKWVRFRGFHEKLDYLRKKSIPIESIRDFQDSELNQLLSEPIQSLAPNDIELLQSSELNELTKEEKIEIKTDLVLLSKMERDEIISKFKTMSDEPNND